MILNRIIDAIYVPNACIIEPNFKFFTSVVAILNISNCSRVATCHPPGFVHLDPIDEIKKEKNFIIQFYPDPHGCWTSLVANAVVLVLGRYQISIAKYLRGVSTHI